MPKSRFLACSAAALFLSPFATGLERTAMDRLLVLARTQPNSAAFRELLLKSLGDAEIKKGEAFNSNGADFLFAVETTKHPTLILDDKPAGEMRRSSGSDLWFYSAKLAVGTSHRFHYLIAGAKFGGSYDVPAYRPDSYARPGVPQGRLSAKQVNTSKVYGGMQADYWVYVPAQYDPAVPAALMVWQDGERYNARNSEEQCRSAPVFTGSRKLRTI